MSLDTKAATPAGAAIRVPPGGRLQAALNAAQPGDVIELTAGSTYVGNFTLRKKQGAEWITIRSSAHERLPSPESRVSPSDANLMPKIVSPNTEPAISTGAGAHHFRFIGIEVTTTSPVNFNLIRLEAPRQTSMDRVPTDIIFDRCYIHGTLTGDIRRGIALNGARLAVVGSYLSDVHERGADSQAIAGWNGPGPFRIVNNYLEAAGENVLFGGADPTIPGLVPADIEMRGNHVVKPLAWKVDEPDYAGIPWTVKNLFELKNARRVLVEGNVFERNWVAAQTGFAILLTVRNQDGGAPWAVVEDVTFTNNIVRHVGAGINFLGWDNKYPSEQTKRIIVQNNLFVDVGGPVWGGGRLFQLLDGTADVVIDHNTALHADSPIVASGRAHTSFVFTNNIVLNNQYGVGGDNTFGDPMRTLNTYFPGYGFARNALVGGDPSKYPADNFFPASPSQVGFVDLAGGDYRLAPSSMYKNAGTDGQDIGADINTVTAAIRRWSKPTPPFP